MVTIENESAIPAHLARERTEPTNLPHADFQPPVPAYVSRFSDSMRGVVMAIFGAQHKHKPSPADSALPKLLTFLQSNLVDTNTQPSHHQVASCTDSIGAYNEIVVIYWTSKADYDRWLWQSGFDTWWKELNPQQQTHGWFKEVFYPPIDRFETVFSGTDSPEGVAHMQETFSGPVREHIYWGSMRDRLPISQTDKLTGVTLTARSNNNNNTTTQAQRIHVPGRKNLAIIRSGQDWSATTPHERELYLNTMHPVLIRGMEFLRDQGEEVGCISNHFMSVLDSETLRPDGIDKTYGLGYFDDLASLEKWSKQHKTHLDIFGRFLQYAQELQGEVSLGLFHEVLVLEADQQEFEYVNCHGRTGMLASR